jgi:hypothetical protein
MRGRPIWGLSAWAGFVCALFALSSLLHGTPAASALLLGGAVLLFGWAVWLAHHRH